MTRSSAGVKMLSMWLLPLCLSAGVAGAQSPAERREAIRQAQQGVSEVKGVASERAVVEERERVTADQRKKAHAEVRERNAQRVAEFQKYEYRCADVQMLFDAAKLLNDHAAEGWRYVGFVGKQVCFERPIL